MTVEKFTGQMIKILNFIMVEIFQNSLANTHLLLTYPQGGKQRLT